MVKRIGATDELVNSDYCESKCELEEGDSLENKLKIEALSSQSGFINTCVLIPKDDKYCRLRVFVRNGLNKNLYVKYEKILANDDVKNSFTEDGSNDLISSFKKEAHVTNYIGGDILTKQSGIGYCVNKDLEVIPLRPVLMLGVKLASKKLLELNKKSNDGFSNTTLNKLVKNLSKKIIDSTLVNFKEVFTSEEFFNLFRSYYQIESSMVIEGERVFMSKVQGMCVDFLMARKIVFSTPLPLFVTNEYMKEFKNRLSRMKKELVMPINKKFKDVCEFKLSLRKTTLGELVYYKLFLICTPFGVNSKNLIKK